VKTTLILLAGRKGVGKSTSAVFLQEKLQNRDNRAHRKSFAAKLKDIAAYIGIPIELSTGSLEDKNSLTNYSWSDVSPFLKARYPNKYGPMTVRDVLQVLGTDVFRDCFCDNVWVQSLISDITDEVEYYRHAIGWQFLNNLYYLIDDCRLENEVRNFPGFDRTIKILIKRPTALQDSHKSETALDNLPPIYFDYIINNDGTMAQLEQKLSKILGDIAGG